MLSIFLGEIPIIPVVIAAFLIGAGSMLAMMFWVAE